MDPISNNFWEATYRQNISKMIGVCCRYTQNRQTAEDLAHDAFILAINKVSSFENKGPFEAWLRRIAVNVALQYLRQQKKQEILEQAPSYLAVYGDVIEEHPGNDSNTFSEAELLEVIGDLPEHHRIVFNLYVVDNFTHAQIAAQLGISEGTSKSHLARARKKIRELLHAKLQKDKERKRALIWLIFPYKMWDVDQLIAGRLTNFAISPKKELAVSQFDNNYSPVPKYKAGALSNKIFLKTSIWVFGAIVIVTGISNFKINSSPEKKALLKSAISNPITADSTNLNQPITATNPENPIIDEKTKNSGTMKNLKTLGGLLLTGLAIDSNALPTELPVLLKNRPIAISQISVPVKNLESVMPAAKPEPMSGTFYASRLFWSEADRGLYLKGKHIKADLTNHKFTGSGTITFLNKINYLIVNGTPMKLNETLELTDKKYYLIVLDEVEGSRKYGEKGSQGVVEISLAE